MVISLNVVALLFSADHVQTISGYNIFWRATSNNIEICGNVKLSAEGNFQVFRSMINTEYTRSFVLS